MRKRIRQLENLSSQNTPRLATVKLASSNKIGPIVVNGRQLDWKAKIGTQNGLVEATLLTDTGASAQSFVKRSFVKQNKLSLVLLERPIQLQLADGSLGLNITHMAMVNILLGEHRESLWCLVTDIPNHDIILGEPWLEQHGPLIDHTNRTMTFNSEFCCSNCNPSLTSVTVKGPGSKLKRKRKDKPREDNLTGPPQPHQDADITQISAYAFLKMARREQNSVVALWPEHFKALEQPAENDKYLIVSNFTTRIAAITPADYDKFFSKLDKKPMSKEELLARLPDVLKDQVDCFDHKEANKLPPHRKEDHKIRLVPGATPPAKKTYGLSRDQAAVVKAYVDEMLGKGYIRPSSSDYAAPVLVVKKPGGGLRVCIDYRALNALTIKDRNSPPLIRETLARLCAAKYYTKLDVIVAFNKIRIAEGDEEKTAFLTRYGLYEYVVMPFGLCNAPGTFQSYINETLREYLDDFCSAYLDDVLIYSNNKEEHTIHVRKVLAKLKAAGLYLDIDKCEFFVTEVKYLGLVITTEGVKMDPDKVKAVLEWKTPKNLKDVQAFLGFANFYRKFIAGYSKLVQPLTAITRASEKNFLFPWNPDGPEEKAFVQLKLAFTQAPILQHFDPDKETWIETDASDYVVAAVLSQLGADGLLHPVAFMSQKMLPAECNYEIYDKELLAIVRAFEEWRPECAGTPVENPIKVISDHRNLEHFMTTKQLNRRQARWAEFLAEFNFKITYRPGAQGTKPDSLTRRTDDLPADDSDERKQFNNQIILKPKNLDVGVRKAIALSDELHQLEDATTKLAVMAYGLTTQVAADTVQQDPDLMDEDSSDDEDNAGELPPPPATTGQTEIQSGPTHTTEELAERQSSPTTPEPSEINTLDFLPRIRAAYEKDKNIKAIMKAKRNGDRKIPAKLIKKGIRLELGDCVIKDNLLWVKDRLCIPKSPTLRTDIIKHIHDSPQGGHAGRTITYQRLSTHYYWQNMTSSVSRYVKACQHCKRTKAYRHAKHGLLKPLPIPERYFQEITVDFITPLPVCKRNGRNYRHIMVVVDRLSKTKRFVALESLDVDAVVQAFIDWIWRIEGFPNTIISDRGTQYTADFWRRLSKRVGTHLKHSTSFHPETDGQTEIANSDLKEYLRAYCNYQQDDWYDWLPFAEFEANSAPSSSTTVAPFLATKGYIPRSGLEPAGPIEGTPSAQRQMEAADEFVKKMADLQEFLRAELIWAQAKQEEQANRGRHPAPELKVGDKVMLDARYIQTMRPNKSLDHKNLGPYVIKRVIHNTAYELELPESMKSVFPVFHPWLLHPLDGDPLPGQHIPDPPPVIIRDEPEWEIDRIVDSRLNRRANDPVSRKKGLLQYRVRYKGFEEWNQRPEWQPYNDLENAGTAVAQFHEDYPEKPGPHATYKLPDDWVPASAD